MIHFSYTLKCWALGITFFVFFYFGILPSDPSFDTYTYPLAMSALLLPLSKSAVDVISDSLAPNVILFNGLLSSILINIAIWLFTFLILAFALIAFLFYSAGIIKQNLLDYDRNNKQ